MTKVLFIDDDPVLHRLVRLALGDLGGFDVVLAHGGEVGIALAHSEAPDAILLDVMMPSPDGPEVLARLRAAEPTAKIPVAFLTGADDRNDELCALGAVGTIAKPFNPATLAAQVRTLFQL